MTVVSPDELVELDRARNRPDPVHPTVFWALVWGTPLVATLLLALHTWARPFPYVGDVAGDTLLFVCIAVLLVVCGELLPVLSGRAKDPTGVAWSTPFAFAVLLTLDAVPAVLLYAGATLFSGAVSRQAPYRVAFNAGQYALSVLAADAVLGIFGIESSLLEPWAPAGAVDLVACLVAGGTFFLVNELLVSVRDRRSDRRQPAQRVRRHARLRGGRQRVAAAPRPPGGDRDGERAPAHAPRGDPGGRDPHQRGGCPSRARGRPRTTTSPASPTAAASTRRRHGWSVSSPPTVGPAVGWRSSCSTWTASRRSTTSWATPPATASCRTSRTASRPRCPEAHVVARLGGDEFAFLHSVSGPEDALALGEQVAVALRDPYRHESGQLVDIDASVGIALAPEHGDDLEVLFSRADVAMYVAKRENRGHGAVRPARPAAASISRLGILGSLRRALDDDELYLDFQPKVDLGTRALVGVEALVRWRHPSGVLVLPDEFIPAAEHSGLMPRLTERVLDLALKQAHEWRAIGLDVPVAVNVSLRDLLQPEFCDRLVDMLRQYEVPPTNLTLEVTERVLAGDLAQARNSMVRLHKLGVGLSMDDFGTGWSSLLMLRALPVTEVKLDRSFVSRALDSEMDLAIVAKVTELAHALGLTVVAEGVETMPVLNRLADLGCDQAQGWHVAQADGRRRRRLLDTRHVGGPASGSPHDLPCARTTAAATPTAPTAPTSLSSPCRGSPVCGRPRRPARQRRPPSWRWRPAAPTSRSRGTTASKASRTPAAPGAEVVGRHPRLAAMSAISADQVAHLARLARIDLTDDERLRLAGQLDGILDAVAQVQQAAGPDVPATSHPLPLTNVFRDDEVRPSLGVEAALSGSPAHEQDRFRVPRILDEE